VVLSGESLRTADSSFPAYLWSFLSHHQKRIGIFGTLLTAFVTRRRGMRLHNANRIVHEMRQRRGIFISSLLQSKTIHQSSFLRLDGLVDLVQLSFAVDVPIAVLLGMDQITVDGHLKEAGGARGSLARHFELALAELVYELSFELVELGLVPSGAAVNHVDF